MPKFKCAKDRSKLIFTREHDQLKATFDLADQSCYNAKGRQIKSLNSFFINSSFSDIEWEDLAYRKFVYTISSNNRRLRNVGSMLTELYNFRHNEGYILLGLPVRYKMNKPISDMPKSVVKYLVNRFAVPDTDLYNTGNWQFTNWLGFFNDEALHKLQFIQLIEQLDLPNDFNNLDLSDLNSIFSMSRDYSMDMKSLVLKISEYIMREGLTLHETIRNLNDYNRMSKNMTAKYQKYPKYLLSTHHIVVRNYNAFREQYEETAFQRMVQTDLAHKGVSYSVLTPESSQDIKDEGASQHHCVASYVKSVINGSTQIVFMRSNTCLEKPLLTIEVAHGKVYQAKGTYNRPATEDELKFIHTYAKAHNLGVSTYL